MECGIIKPKGISYARKTILCIVENAGNELTMQFSALLSDLYEEKNNLRDTHG